MTSPQPGNTTRNPSLSDSPPPSKPTAAVEPYVHTAVDPVTQMSIHSIRSRTGSSAEAKGTIRNSGIRI